MATIVTGDQKSRISTKLAEIQRQVFLQASYPFDLEQLDQHLQLATEGKFAGVVKETTRKTPIPPIPPDHLIINRSTPFNPETFIGKDWRIWRGPKDGDGLAGEEEQDKRSMALTTFDPTQITQANLQTGLNKGETVITGEVKLARLIVQQIQADAKFAEALYQEEGQKTLRYLYETLGFIWLEFLGTVLRRPDGRRFAISLYRYDSGEWDWNYRWLDFDRGASRPSLGFAS